MFALGSQRSAAGGHLGRDKTATTGEPAQGRDIGRRRHGSDPNVSSATAHCMVVSHPPSMANPNRAQDASFPEVHDETPLTIIRSEVTVSAFK
jgi:hypothetical protein